MINVKATKEHIAALQAELKAAELTTQAAAREAAKAMVTTWEYRVTQTSAHVFRIERRLDTASIARREAFEQEYGQSYANVQFGGHDQHQWHGMNYVIIDRFILAPGGGHVVLNLGQRWSSDEPMELTQEQVNAICAGEVPVELRHR